MAAQMEKVPQQQVAEEADEEFGPQMIHKLEVIVENN
jgi:hypothetical protein